MGPVEDATSKLVKGVDELKAAILDAQSAQIAAETLYSVVELSALQASSLLEDFLEELFYLCMLGKHPLTEARAVIPLASRRDVNLLIYSDGRRREKYLNWLPWDRIEARADAYLEDGRPFDRIRYRPVETRALSELTTVRNAVAHSGAFASQVLIDLGSQKGYKVNRPADYLLSLRSGFTEVLLLMTQVEIIARALSADSDISADSLLQPETPFKSAQPAPAGEYKCLRCGQIEVISTRGKVGVCPNCGTTTKCPTCGRLTVSSSEWKRSIL